MNIKLGQILHNVEMLFKYDVNDVYKPRLKHTVWVVCKIGKADGIRTPISLSDGVNIVKARHIEDGQWFKNNFKTGEVLKGYFTSEKAALKQFIEKKPRYKDDEDYVNEWCKEQTSIKRRLAKI